PGWSAAPCGAGDVWLGGACPAGGGANVPCCTGACGGGAAGAPGGGGRGCDCTPPRGATGWDGETDGPGRACWYGCCPAFGSGGGWYCGGGAGRAGCRPGTSLGGRGGSNSDGNCASAGAMGAANAIPRARANVVRCMNSSRPRVRRGGAGT